MLRIRQHCAYQAAWLLIVSCLDVSLNCLEMAGELFQRREVGPLEEQTMRTLQPKYNKQMEKTVAFLPYCFAPPKKELGLSSESVPPTTYRIPVRADCV